MKYSDQEPVPNKWIMQVVSEWDKNLTDGKWESRI